MKGKNILPLLQVLDEYDERNSKIKFKYLDTSGNTDKFIFHISGFYEYVKRFNSMSDEEKYNLKIGFLRVCNISKQELKLT